MVKVRLEAEDVDSEARNPLRSSLTEERLSSEVRSRVLVIFCVASHVFCRRLALDRSTTPKAVPLRKRKMTSGRY